MPTIICSPVRPLHRFRDFYPSSCCDYTGLIVATRKTSLRRRRPGQPAPPAPPVPRIAAPWHLRKSRGLQILELVPFCKLPWLVHGFSTRPGGVSPLESEKVLNLGFMEWDTRENVLENRRLFQSALGAAQLPAQPALQVHADVIRIFPQPSADLCKGDYQPPGYREQVAQAGTAFCVPILLVDPKKR